MVTFLWFIVNINHCINQWPFYDNIKYPQTVKCPCKVAEKYSYLGSCGFIYFGDRFHPADYRIHIALFTLTVYQKSKKLF